MYVGLPVLFTIQSPNAKAIIQFANHNSDKGSDTCGEIFDWILNLNEKSSNTPRMNEWHWFCICMSVCEYF